MISANEFRNGMVIKFNNSMYQIVHFQHVKMQQRAPIVRTKMASLNGGNTLEQAFRSGDKFEEVFLERKDIQYLYNDGDLLHFMNNEDFEDVVVAKSMLGEQMKYLRDNDNVIGLYCDGDLLTVELPAIVTLKVAEVDPGLRGDTAKSGTKPATMETGAVVKVPLFVNTGDVIKVDTRTGTYVERA